MKTTKKTDYTQYNAVFFSCFHKQLQESPHSVHVSASAGLIIVIEKAEATIAHRLIEFLYSLCSRYT